MSKLFIKAIVARITEYDGRRYHKEAMFEAIAPINLGSMAKPDKRIRWFKYK